MTDDPKCPHATFLNRCRRVLSRFRRAHGWPVPVSRPKSFAVEGERFVARWPFPGVDEVLRDGESSRRGFAVHPAATCLPRPDEQVCAAQRGAVTPAEAARRRSNSRGCDIDEERLMCRAHGQPIAACMFEVRRYVAVEPMVVIGSMRVVIRGPGGDT